jgi:hypothetical protein
MTTIQNEQEQLATNDTSSLKQKRQLKIQIQKPAERLVSTTSKSVRCVESTDGLIISHPTRMEAKQPPKKKYPEYDPHRGCDGCVDPLYMGFVSAADYKKFMEKQIYYDILFKQPLWTTELPKVEPYYSQCLKEFQEGMKNQQASKAQGKTAERHPTKKKAAGPASKQNKKAKVINPPKKKKSLPATNRKQAPSVAPIFASKTTAGSCKTPRGPSSNPPFSTTSFTKPNLVTPHPSHKNPLTDSTGKIDRRDYTFPPNWPNMPSGYPTPRSCVGERLGSGVDSGVFVNWVPPKMCNHCMLLPCIVDAHFDQLLDINSESEVLLCDPPDITFRKLEAFFRRLIVKYFGIEYMKLLGSIPVCAEEKCHHLASREETTEFEHM